MLRFIILKCSRVCLLVTFFLPFYFYRICFYFYCYVLNTAVFMVRKEKSNLKANPPPLPPAIKILSFFQPPTIPTPNY